jgi:hypothetical protein
MILYFIQHQFVKSFYKHIHTQYIPKVGPTRDIIDPKVPDQN